MNKIYIIITWVADDYNTTEIVAGFNSRELAEKRMEELKKVSGCECFDIDEVEVMYE